jgi:uncharacterized protein involved in exopolysaccharide biosynthesis
VYRSTATIIVQSQQIPAELARSTITNGTEERLESIRQRLMTRENLLQMAEKLGLFQDRPDLSPTDRAQKLRDATEIRIIPVNPGSRNRGPVSSFTISFKADDASMAARTTNEFVSLVLEENLRNRIDRATETSTFFKRELQRIEAALAETETGIAVFKQQNEAMLPETLDLRREELSELTEMSFTIENQVIVLEEEMGAVRTAMEEGGGPALNSAVAAKPLSPVEKDLARLQSDYRNLSAIYADSHPRMKVLLSQIASLETIVAADAEAAAAAIDTGEPNASPQERLARIQGLQRIGEIERQIALLEDRQTELTARRSMLEASIMETPEVEKALSEMTRTKIDLQMQYEQIVSKLAEAEIGELLEVNRQGERFEVIEQAEVASRPEKPNRMVILAGGVLASLMMGVGLVVGLELLNRSIRTVGDLERTLQSHAFSVIPYIRTAKEVRMMAASWILCIGVFIGAGTGAAYAVDRFYLPLNVVLEKVAERTGVQGMLMVIKDRINS